ncbi:transcriptional repressor MprA [Polystyrenella longa]|uniref:Transcriptional repressor MprA n=1 Tax=Polystyrenella longa TaxID=2528007 RepID=A0A518CR02_9PLAN|nr:MarR family transcriptional regulator [Polystyrenella longa]QDU81662.1 transcriptional repressor MprA [Polystyrenella longa]
MEQNRHAEAAPDPFADSPESLLSNTFAEDRQSIPFPQESAATKPVDSVEQETTLLLRTVLGQIDEELQLVYDQSDLNEARIEILKALSLAHPQGCTQVELAQSLGQSEANISAMVARMRRDGWVYRIRSQADRRKSNLLLTTKSLQILGQVQGQINQLLTRLFASLHQNESQQLLSLLGKLHLRLTSSAHPAAPVEYLKTAGKQSERPVA